MQQICENTQETWGTDVIFDPFGLQEAADRRGSSLELIRGNKTAELQ